MQKQINYFNPNGVSLAVPPKSFTETCPILCLHREHLQEVLVDSITGNDNGPKIIFNNGVQFTNAKVHNDYLSVELCSGEHIECDLLIGADGLHSNVRNFVFPAKPHYCGYTYYRATVDKNEIKDSNISDDIWYDNSFESWGKGKRFGYVPLKKPDLFWFASIPSKPMISRDGNSNLFTTCNISENDKNSLFEQFQNYKSPIDIAKLIDSTNSKDILRTDIYKIPVLSKWSEGRIVLLGDSVHATSPNLAQGAGLAIEDAMQLARDIDQVNLGNSTLEESLQNYQKERFSRAKTVQTIADGIATVGQMDTLSPVRDFSMSFATKVFPKLQQKIFEDTARFSLGWNWSVPKINDECLWERVLKDDFKKLPDKMKNFRKSSSGSGIGTCSVEYPNILAEFVGKVLFFPPKMIDEKFYAGVKNETSSHQKWTRIFGYGTSKATSYSTNMVVHRQNPKLVEKKGIFEFEYKVKYNDEEKKIFYNTSKFYLTPGILLPDIISPYSEWFEVPTENGWKFDGYISLPFIGKIFRYHGSFDISNEK